MPIDATIHLILGRYSIERHAVRVDSLGTAGGLSGALFWRISTPQGEFALRRWPSEHPTPDRLRWIHAMLRHASEHGFTMLPVPLATHDGLTFIEHGGHLWELSPWLPGVADYWRTPRVEKLPAAMRALATFHVAVANYNAKDAEGAAAGATAIIKRLDRLRELTPPSIAMLQRSINDSTWPQLTPLARDFAAVLPLAAPRAEALLESISRAALPLQPCIRDVWHDHILFTGDEITGIIDFGAADIDIPATDVARLLGSFVINDLAQWQNGLAAYESVRPLSDEERQALPALDASGTVLAGCNWIRWIYREGRQFENRQQVVERFGRLLERVRAL